MAKTAKVIGVALALTLGLGTPLPSHAAISAQLAKTCRDMMIKAHPLEVFGQSGSAAAQRAYFAECVRRNADKADDKGGASGNPPTSTTGQGQ